MPFFASRTNGRDDASQLRGLGAVQNTDTPPNLGTVESSGLPPWVESAVKKLLAQVLPQFQPLVTKTESVLAEAQEALAGLKRDQARVTAELASLRLAQIEGMTQLAAMKASVDRLALLSVDPC
jgi:hypothetical protein